MPADVPLEKSKGPASWEDQYQFIQVLYASQKQVDRLDGITWESARAHALRQYAASLARNNITPQLQAAQLHGFVTETAGIMQVRIAQALQPDIADEDRQKALTFVRELEFRLKTATRELEALAAE